MGALQGEQGIQDLRGIVQVKQESAVILANDLDFDRFTPEQLVAHHVVPEDWDCWRFERFTDSTRIEYQQLTFRMVEGQLWINSFPNCSLADLIQRAPSSSAWSAARKYLENSHFVPISGLWAYWKLSAVGPSWFQWMVDTLAPKWPDNEGRISDIQTTLDFEQGGERFKLLIRNDRQSQSGGRDWESMDFDCYSYPPNVLRRSEAIAECDRWMERTDAS